MTAAAPLPVVAGVDGSDVSVRADRVLESVAASLRAACSPGRIDWAVEQGDPVDVLRSASAGAQLVVVSGQGAGGTNAPRVGASAAALTASARAPVIGQRRRGPWGTLRSTTRAVLRQATGPIAVVPIAAGNHPSTDGAAR